jgi:DNA-binding MarR family transcriptional regulator
MSDPAVDEAQAPAVDLTEMPGHLIRRLQQIAVAAFLQESEAFALTPVQFAALQAVAAQPRMDQRTLSGLIGLDTSTVAGVVDRLEARGLLQRQASPEDRRVRLLVPTASGRLLLADAVPAMLRAQQRILEPLPPADRTEFLRMLRLLVTGNNELSRAPTQG